MDSRGTADDIVGSLFRHLNACIAECRARYQDLIGAEGVLKTLFKAVKAAAGGQGLERVFMTGVSPVVLADITSGRLTALSWS